MMKVGLTAARERLYDAVEIQLKNGRRYRIGTDEPAELLGAVESVIANTEKDCP